MSEIKMPKSWQELHDENIQLRFALEYILTYKSGKYRDLYNYMREIAESVLAKYPKEAK